VRGSVFCVARIRAGHASARVRIRADYASTRVHVRAGRASNNPMPNNSMPNSPMSSNPTHVHPYEDVKDDDVCLEPENTLAAVEQPVRRSTHVTSPPIKFTDYVMYGVRNTGVRRSEETYVNCKVTVYK
jgi:hypothetical protein